MLYGLLVHQSSHYFRRFAKDTSINKAFTGVIPPTSGNRAQLDMHVALQSGSPQIYPLITGLCVCVSQCFYARRVYLISVKYRILVTLAVVLSAVTLVFTIAATVIACLTKQLERFVPDIWIDTASYASTVVSDAITTGVLVYNLKGYRTGIERTDAFLDCLASYAINTGLLIGIMNTLLLILSLFGKKIQVVFLAIGIPSTKLYANSVLAALNSRIPLAGTENPVSTHLEFTTMNEIANSNVEARMATPVLATHIPRG
ncbi:hypothetical protein PYCCODRAFT_506920 [Trametes coccinea BRFM310]|uniref:DUF6534 domain-containing protein n=1 Tax=Trametes coccinea (strain BRFM310) TaxID=1353009 RepID=A0A1Y2IMB5_TRAC3|nr:hypothetical protein PYCCODRAFT_506920 [Trametes coccinea BRFM310]